MKLLGLKNAWLSPSGDVIVRARDFYGDWAWHETLADCIIRDLNKLKSIRDVMDFIEPTRISTEWLEDRGWVRLHMTIKPKWIVDSLLTSDQRLIIEEWCAINGVLYDDSVDIID